MIKESDLYLPVKSFLTELGYSVKAEIKGCDLVALKPESAQLSEQYLIVELKLNFSLELLLQGVSRQAISDNVFLAVWAADTPKKRKNWRAKQSSYLQVCRKLGLGLMLVELSEDLIAKEASEDNKSNKVKVLLEPAPYSPRKNKHRQSALMNEFNARQGDPNLGGVNKTKIMTAYRQSAIKCASVLHTKGSLSPKQMVELTNIATAATIMQRNHYGWFDRISRGVYVLSLVGQRALLAYQNDEINMIAL